VDLVLVVGPAADDNVIYPSTNSLTVPDAPAFLNPKGILMYSKRPKGMVVAVFCTSAGLTGIWW
jgi:hypothetical protein